MYGLQLLSDDDDAKEVVAMMVMVVDVTQYLVATV